MSYFSTALFWCTVNAIFFDNPNPIGLEWVKLGAIPPRAFGYIAGQVSCFQYPYK